MLGSIRFDVKASSPEDLLIGASITDVHCRGDFIPGLCSPANGNAVTPDYAGTLQGIATARITDHFNCDPNATGCTEYATAQDIDYGFQIPCTTTPSDLSVGSTCGVITSANTLLAGTITDSKRENWQSGEARVLDGGGDGDASTLADNSVFLRQGCLGALNPYQGFRDEAPNLPYKPRPLFVGAGAELRQRAYIGKQSASCIWCPTANR
jgi:hypothetical protein